MPKWSKHRHHMSGVFQCPHPSGHLAPLLLPSESLTVQVPKTKEIPSLEAWDYIAYPGLKLRLGCSNIQSPKPCDLQFSSSKALIYYYY